MNYKDYITIEPGKRSGKSCIRGLRITVSDVLEYLASGMTEAEILADFPDLTALDIWACLAFTADRERIAESYLRSDAVIDWLKPSIVCAAREITAALNSDVEKAKALFEWVRDRIPHTNDAGREEVTCAASEVLSAGTGICYAKAHLLAALLRAIGIPAGFCYQVYYEDLHVSQSKMALHGLNGIYLESLGRWIRVDTHGNKAGVSAQFDTETERLAFPELEFLDNRIYVDPLPNVVQALRTWPTKTSLWPHLPGLEELRGHTNGNHA